MNVKLFFYLSLPIKNLSPFFNYIYLCFAVPSCSYLTSKKPVSVFISTILNANLFPIYTDISFSITKL